MCYYIPCLKGKVALFAKAVLAIITGGAMLFLYLLAFEGGL